MPPDHEVVAHSDTRENKSNKIDTCSFRKYPPRRYYGLNKKPTPDFLQNVSYIWGEAPQLIAPKNADDTLKLCVNQSEWYKQNPESLPFADGTNPSVLKLKDNPRIHQDFELQHNLPSEAYYLATICMTNSQCAWKDSPQEQRDYKISHQEKPSTVRTVLLILNEHFETLAEATIYTLIDAKFGRRIRPKEQDGAGNFEKKFFALDDARLFTYRGDVWVSYREGPNFGYDKQVLNKLHFSSEGGLSVTLKASEVETLCCGRNMALIDNVHTDGLDALTWVDPVTVESVALRASEASGRRLSLEEEDAANLLPRSLLRRRRRRLLTETKKKKKKQNDFHGTNGFMVYLPKTQEYLGIGHFHRPPGREANEYARFGHHYTHAFYTISDQPPWHLKRLSPELLLPSQSYKDDAEIIQFWSGLERVDDNLLALAYGINDCEGAAMYMEMSIVEALLRVVPQGKEVRDLMMPVTT